MESSQEAYVTIKYRLENNGSEPKLNDIGVRHVQKENEVSKGSEPKLNDIGVRLKPMNGLSILPVLIEVETSLKKIIRKKVR